MNKEQTKMKRRAKNQERPMWFVYVLKDDGGPTDPQYITGDDLGNALQRLAVSLPDKASELQIWRVSDDPIRTATVHRIKKAKPKSISRAMMARAHHE